MESFQSLIEKMSEPFRHISITVGALSPPLNLAPKLPIRVGMERDLVLTPDFSFHPPI